MEQGIGALRSLKKTNPDRFSEIVNEYMEMKTRTFCTKYKCGVTGAVLLFGRKKPPKITILVSPRDLNEEDVDLWVQMRDQQEAERKELMASRYRPGDIDEYYNRK